MIINKKFFINELSIPVLGVVHTGEIPRVWPKAAKDIEILDMKEWCKDSIIKGATKYPNLLFDISKIKYVIHREGDIIAIKATAKLMTTYKLT